MNIKSTQTLLLTMLVLIGLACTKTDDAPEQTPDLFIRFNNGGELVEWRESDGIDFTAISGTSTSSGWPDSTLLNYFVKIEKEIPLGGGASTFEGITLVFNHKVPSAELTGQDFLCLTMINDGFFDLFAPGNWNVATRDCPDILEQKELVIGGNFTTSGQLSSGSSGAPDGCDTSTSLPYDQTGSFFSIDSQEKYDHPTQGEGFLIGGFPG